MTLIAAICQLTQLHRPATSSTKLLVPRHLRDCKACPQLTLYVFTWPSQTNCWSSCSATRLHSCNCRSQCSVSQAVKQPRYNGVVHLMFSTSSRKNFKSVESFITEPDSRAQCVALEENVKEFGLTYFGLRDKRQGSSTMADIAHSCSHGTQELSTS